MSYILEALKKAEQNRQREEPLELLTFSGESAPERKKRSLWPYLLLAVLLLNAGVITWWIVPWQTGKEGASVQPPAVQQTATVAPKGVENREQGRTGDTKEVPQAKEADRAPLPAAEKAARELPLPVAAKSSATDRMPSEPQIRTEKKVAAVDRLFSLKELPPAVKSALPEFKITGHAYSPEPQTRVVRVNEKILQEGQELSPGLKVEEIVPGGIIFGYQGYRFRIGAGENR
jgi:general secretion pathway protein B